MSDAFPADPTVVVAVPTYNNEHSVRETLELVCEQSRPPDRVVVCDKSSDRTPDIVEAVAGEQDVAIDLIRQRGDGVAAAYDQILDHVAGAYDLFVTVQTELMVPDDWLETHVQIHREHSEIDLVTGDRRSREDEVDLGVGRPTGREVDPDESTYYVGRNFSAKAGTLEAIDGWDRNFLRGEDWDMRIRLAGAETRVFATREAWWEWQEGAEDPPITLSKTKRRPTAVTFLAKYGAWYAWFHPSHVVGDALCLAAVAFAALAVPMALVSPLLALGPLALVVLSVLAYVGGTVALRGGVDDSLLVAPLRKQFLVGIGVCYAAVRILRERPDWNMAGFDPEHIPRYKF